MAMESYSKALDAHTALKPKSVDSAKSKKSRESGLKGKREDYYTNETIPDDALFMVGMSHREVDVTKDEISLYFEFDEPSTAQHDALKDRKEAGLAEYLKKGSSSKQDLDKGLNTYLRSHCMQQRKDLKLVGDITVIGYASLEGDNDYNKNLGFRRAWAVRNYICQEYDNNSFDTIHVEALSLGEDTTDAQSRKAKSRWKDRKVVVKLNPEANYGAQVLCYLKSIESDTRTVEAGTVLLSSSGTRILAAGEYSATATKEGVTKSDSWVEKLPSNDTERDKKINYFKTFSALELQICVLILQRAQNGIGNERFENKEAKARAVRRIKDMNALLSEALIKKVSYKMIL